MNLEIYDTSLANTHPVHPSHHFSSEWTHINFFFCRTSPGHAVSWVWLAMQIYLTFWWWYRAASAFEPLKVDSTLSWNFRGTINSSWSALGVPIYISRFEDQIRNGVVTPRHPNSSKIQWFWGPISVQFSPSFCWTNVGLARLTLSTVRPQRENTYHTSTASYRSHRARGYWSPWPARRDEVKVRK
jgi:hypothetical protein